VNGGDTHTWAVPADDRMPDDGGPAPSGAGGPTVGEATGSAGGEPQRPAWLAALGLASPDRPLLHQLGLGAWSLLGLIALTAVIVVALATVSSVVLPLLFAIVLAVLFRPLGARLERRGVPPSLAAGAVVLGLVFLCAAVVALTVRGVVSQSDRIVDEVESALVELDVDDDAVEEARSAVEGLDPSVTSGFAKVVVAGLSAIAGLVVGALLGVLIMYYLIKDGVKLRRTLVGRAPPDQATNLDEFISEVCFVIRRYWLGRTIVSAVVAAVVGIAALLLGLPLVLTLVVVTFVGGYVPYIGAVVGGGLAVAVALGSSGVGAALAMLAVALAANLLVENLIEPAVTGRTLQVHPLVVLLVTTIGGIVGGLVGLVLAVPLTVIASKAVPRLARAVDFDTDRLRDTITGQ
jgi:predicted PurR-regulated permease PerM